MTFDLEYYDAWGWLFDAERSARMLRLPPSSRTPSHMPILWKWTPDFAQMERNSRELMILAFRAERYGPPMPPRFCSSRCCLLTQFCQVSRPLSSTKATLQTFLNALLLYDWNLLIQLDCRGLHLSTTYKPGRGWLPELASLMHSVQCTKLCITIQC